MSAPANIFVIGEIGVGKSSVINLITGTNVAEASDGANAGTLGTKKHHYKNLVLWDTMGFNDVNEKNATELIKNLSKLALDVNESGISLILFVMKKGRITNASKINYDYFVKTFCGNNVPVLLLVTHCEHESPPDSWYSSQTDVFEMNGMTFGRTICGTAIDLHDPKLNRKLIPVFADIRAETQDNVRRSIMELKLATAWKPTSLIDWLPVVFCGALLICGMTVAAVNAALPYANSPLGPAVTAAVKAYVVMKMRR